MEFVVCGQQKSQSTINVPSRSNLIKKFISARPKINNKAFLSFFQIQLIFIAPHDTVDAPLIVCLATYICFTFVEEKFLSEPRD
ncbi:hypothetical protein PHAVU_003G244200 [Phaseolus vulgaris]|uniref:Uncharacterized protein n=1 Tax=Phaseolus vulgaris TaxID=3885 RepID=V7CCK3_PHAVU|nr:hypothetical protein PHAVU_003G244200g [Phaseolus vulgaris]ESW27922.1 hypothetical protein PHAVU_003G244200g [Phaseolus vulgaris]